MKKLPYFLILLLLISCGGLSKIFNGGSINPINYKETISFNYDHNYPLIQVEINSKTYTFLVDTGAPTAVSSAIFKDLNVERADYVVVEDSQGQVSGQDVVVIPEVKIGALTYNNIGAVVVDLRNVFEFDCMGIDGIIGANQMAKSYWKFDYQNKEITITDQLINYDLTAYKDTLSFAISDQKTPYLRGHVNGMQTTFIYDTGFGGHIDVNKKLGEFKDAEGFMKYGNSGLGLYGVIDSTSIRTIKTDSLRIGKIEMGAQMVDLDHFGLIGNDFMNKFDVVMDWSTQKIYLKKVQEFETTETNSFGFKYRIKENKAVVTGLIEELPIDLKLGDTLLSINDYDFRNITDLNACEIWQSMSYKDVAVLNVVYEKDGKEYNLVLDKKTLIE